MKDNLPIASDAQEKAGAGSGESPLIEITGLGDEALWTRVNGALTVRHANLTMVVTGPSDRRTQSKVAQQVLELLR